MATHYVYEDPDKNQLRQGDVLERTPGLTALLTQYHPHYAEHSDYQFFAILTQSCDLVRRDNKPPKSPYIAIAAARTLEETLLREAAKRQDTWQREAKVIGEKERNALLMFLQRVMDNNEPGYFYLHDDQSVGLHSPCCVVLALAVTLRAEHYDMLLDAKIAQVTDTFQAKFGWLIANMYGRVGTTEWNTEYPDNQLKKVTKTFLNDTLHSVQDAQIKEGVAELRQAGTLDNMTPDAIFKHIRSINILSRRKKLEQRALAVCDNVNLVNLMQGRTRDALNKDDALRNAVLRLLATAEVDEAICDDLAQQLTQLFNDCLGRIMTDAELPGRNEVIEALIRVIMEDAQVAAILR